ncbi:amphi-Trp domain-containing protein [Stieleria sp. TO1_6]|uniref:amphi-Trp domain-containing protein n=1 Tax=Stieleria tagensis TaxID=2956795 RepID=UPI00209B1BBC|nr:amphi-Trp domain-containing protein [Stieleria tagensis]MCO8122196.1 amphi-Trp domain-containing protein [Stieleria tagensis]
MKQSTRFRHESLQDSESIKRLLNALVEGVNKGKLVLEDEDGTMVMKPKGLANLKISASQDEKKNRLDIRLTWYESTDPVREKDIKISTK